VPPSENDVHAMVDALLSIHADLDRTRRQTKGASRRRLLDVIGQHDGIRQSAIADRLQVHTAHVARQIRACIDAGFVALGPDPDDRRSSLVTLEPAGHAELRRLVELSRDPLARLVDDWEPEQVRTLTGLLDKLRASTAAVSARERRAHRRRPAHGSGLPSWFDDWLSS